MEDNRETDLFDSNTEKISGSGLKNFITESQPSGITLSMEHLFASLILVLVLFFTIFYLGYLRGRASVRPDELKDRSRVAASVSRSEPLLSGVPTAGEGSATEGFYDAPAAARSVRPSVSGERSGAAAPQPSARPSVANTSSKPYTIQVIAFRNRKEAQSELSLLKRKGYVPATKLEGNKWVVLVGRYKNRSEARKDLVNLKKRYRDCYLKKAV